MTEETLDHRDSATCSLVLNNFHSPKGSTLVGHGLSLCGNVNTDTTDVLHTLYSEKLVKKAMFRTWN